MARAERFDPVTDPPLDEHGLPANKQLNAEFEFSPRTARDRANSGAVLLDCRRHDELEIASIDGAEHIPLDELEGRIDDIRELAEAREVIVFCHHGVRSMRATTLLRAMGITNVWSMAGGIDLWSRAVDESVPRY